MRFALVGAGAIGRMRAGSVVAHPECTLVGVVDPHEESARQAAEASGARVAQGLGELLDGDHVDAVIVSTPVALHEDVVLQALAAGKHVFCEKPLANSLAASRRMLEAARESGRTVAVGFNHRFYPAFAYMKQVIDEGRIGRLDEVRVFGAHDGLANFRSKWMYESASLGGGAMLDVGIHMTDLARHYAGEVTEVYGLAGENIWKVPGSEDRAVAVMKTASGAAIQYTASWNEWKGYRAWMEAYGDKGMVRAQYGPMFNLLITQERPGGGRKRRMKLYPEVAIRERLKGWETTTILSFEAELAAFLGKVRGEEVLLADVWDGFRAVEIANAVYESTRTGQPVKLSSS